jgi:hypothetical protein
LKPNKDPALTNAYRPISLLYVLGKITERTIAELINFYLSTSQHPLYTHQYGFRTELSPEPALQGDHSKLLQLRNNLLYSIAVSFDIEAAFDSISYQAILIGCQKLDLPPFIINIIHSYLHSRSVTYQNLIHTPEKGCPQGSILGPLLWNIGYNPVLNVISKLAHVTCFADDTLVILSAPSIQDLQSQFTIFCSLYTSLLSILQVKINVAKTENLFTPGPLRYIEMPVFTFHSQSLTSTDCIKYLGIYLDNNFTFTLHFLYLQHKSQKVINALKPLFAKKYGYSNKARKIMLQGAVSSFWKYGSTIFSHSLLFSKNRRIIRQTHRQMLLLINRSYKTVSYLPLTIISNWPPLDYEIHSRSIIYSHTHSLPFSSHPFPPHAQITRPKDLKHFLTTHTYTLWQMEWDSCTQTGQWTKSLIPQVGTYTFSTSYYITQMLTGHGSFGSYLHSSAEDSFPNH